jgi:uncharacterized 2Fe-2S/4Fe-4S cluster protein (DUF4445 family)
MTTVRFQPTGKTCELPAGAELLDAARAAGVEIETPCGGRGACGQCAVRIVAGRVDAANLAALSATAIAAGYAPACQARLTAEAVTVEVPAPLDLSAEVAADPAADAAGRALLPDGEPPSPLVRAVHLRVPPPQPEDGLADLDRLTRALQAELGPGEIVCPLPALRTVAGALRACDGEATVAVAVEETPRRIVAVEAGSPAPGPFGVAVDVGTTTIAVQLIDLRRAAALATVSDYNAQIACGADVISRINYAQRADRLEELRGRALETINRLIARAAAGRGLAPEAIRAAAVSGNTTMTHLLLGLPPEHIRLAPYTPTVMAPGGPLDAAAVGLAIHPLAPVRLSPAVGSYVGGDITAGLLCTDLARGGADLSLFLDIGTNGELVLGDRHFLMGCACSAGPAFEGGGIGCGMRAAPGAIERVEVDPAAGGARVWTIGSGRPKGICGSGMISLLAGLFRTGWLDPAGKLARGRPSPAIRVDNRSASYVLAVADETAAGRELVISETDIENTIRAKAAIYSAFSLMLRQVDLTFGALTKFYIAGGFGRYLDFDDARTIGLLPELPRERFVYLGNASLAGSALALVSGDARRRQLALARRLTYLDLSIVPGYMEEYTAALFLPHTDRERFPRVS